MRTEKTILIAEDDPGDAFLLENAFAKAGADVHIEFVRDGREVIKYLKGQGRFRDREEHPFPEVLVLDLKLPLLDGFEVLAWLRQQPTFNQLVIGVLTGSDQPRDIQRARDLGASCCFVKPITTAEMVEVVNRLKTCQPGNSGMC